MLKLPGGIQIHTSYCCHPVVVVFAYSHLLAALHDSV
jgi:hypothetical protein